MTAAAPYLEFFDHLVKLDRKRALAVAEGYLAKRGDVLELYGEVLGPALDHAGDEWEHGRISVAHEHYLAEIVLDLIRRHGPTIWADAPEGAPVAVVCGPPRERHYIGLAMLTDALRSGGMVVHRLPECQTAEVVVDLLDRVGADLLCVSCALDVHLTDAEDLIAQARQARPGLLVAVGGGAIRGRFDELQAKLGADVTAADVLAVRRSLPDWLRRLGRPPEPPGPRLLRPVS